MATPDHLSPGWYWADCPPLGVAGAGLLAPADGGRAKPLILRRRCPKSYREKL
jgi:hypothetical protein